MALRPAGFIDLPPNRSDDGLDHAAVLNRADIAYIAHTSNDALDVVDLAQARYLRSVQGFRGVAGVLVSQERELVFTSNRGEHTVSYFPIRDEASVTTVPVGGRPNGLAFDAETNTLLAANVGRLSGPPGFTVSLVDISEGRTRTDIEVPGRTRWAIFDRRSGRFYVNVRDPGQIIRIDPSEPSGIDGAFPIPAAGPHGLEIDSKGRRLFCACDGARLVEVNLESGEVADVAALSGSPDVVFYNPRLEHLYVAIGTPGVLDVFDTNSMTKLESVPTEDGAGTLIFNPETNRVWVILQKSHRLACFVDQ